eukprot:2859884-Alexandrium_andersonii.AAC.1
MTARTCQRHLAGRRASTIFSMLDSAACGSWPALSRRSRPWPVRGGLPSEQATTALVRQRFHQK